MRFIAALSVLSILVILNTCGTPNYCQEHVSFLDSNLNIKATHLVSARVNNLLVVNGSLYNDSNQVIHGYYRCQFYDKQHMLVENLQQWQLVTIYPNTEQVIKCMATATEANDFKLEFAANIKTLKQS